MSPGKWVRGAVAFLATNHPRSERNIAVSVAAMMSLSLLVFANGLGNITEEVMSRDRIPRRLFDGSDHDAPGISGDLTSYCNLLVNLFKKAAGLASTASAHQCACIASNILYSAIALAAPTSQRKARENHLNRASQITAFLSVAQGCFFPSRTMRRPLDRGVPSSFSLLLASVGTSMGAFRVCSQVKRYPYLSAELEQKADALVVFLATQEYKQPTNMEQVILRSAFARKSLLDSIVLARRRKIRKLFMLPSFYAAVRIVDDSHQEDCSSSSEDPETGDEKPVVKPDYEPPSAEPPRKVILISPPQPASASKSEAQHHLRTCHNCTARPKPLPCKRSWVDRSGRTARCANASST